jgi:hypothetical protein
MHLNQSWLVLGAVALSVLWALCQNFADDSPQALLRSTASALSANRSCLQKLCESDLHGDALRAELQKVAAENHVVLDYRQVKAFARSSLVE